MSRLLSLMLIFTPAAWFSAKEITLSKFPSVTTANAYNIDSALMLKLVNEARKKGCNCGNAYMPPVPPLQWNDQLAKAAYDHSLEMNAKKRFSHTSANGSTPGDRILKTGYTWRGCGENIAINNGDEQAVMAGWLKSPGHCKTIMNERFKEFGAARAGDYWTQDFGLKK